MNTIFSYSRYRNFFEIFAIIKTVKRHIRTSYRTYNRFKSNTIFKRLLPQLSKAIWQANRSQVMTSIESPRFNLSQRFWERNLPQARAVFECLRLNGFNMTRDIDFSQRSTTSKRTISNVQNAIRQNNRSNVTAIRKCFIAYQFNTARKDNAGETYRRLFVT